MSRRHRQLGLGLLECLIALAILAIAISAAYRSIGITIEQQPELRDRLLADWVAQDRLVQHRITGYWTDDSETNGQTEQGGQIFVWKESFKNTDNRNFREVTISVFKPEGDHLVAQMRGFITR